MGAIPTFNRTYLPQTGRLIDTGGIIADAAHGLATTVEGLEIQRRNRQAEADAATWYNDQDIQMRKFASDNEDQFKKDNALTENPGEVLEKWNAMLEQKRTEIAEQAPSPAARRAFMEASGKFSFTAGEQIRSWANGQQVNNFATRTDRSAQDLYSLAYRNPTLDNLAQLEPKVEQAVMAGSTFMAADKLQEMRQTMRGNLGRSMVEGLMVSDRAADAKELLKSGALDGYLQAADIQKLTAQAVAAERGEKARMRAEQAQLTSAASVSVSSLESSMQNGFAIPKETLASTAAEVAATGNAKLMRKFNLLQQTHTFQQQLRSEGTAKIREIVGNLRNAAFGHQPDITDDQRDLAIRTIIAEESDPSAQRGVAESILNRLGTGKWGNSIESVVTAKGQFEPHGTLAGRAKMAAIDPNSEVYQQVGALFDDAASNPGADITAGATHFISDTTQLSMGRQIPKWAQQQALAEYGKTRFLAPDGKGAPRRAYTVGGGISEEQALKLKIAEGVLDELDKGMKADPIATIGNMGALPVQPVSFAPDPDGGTKGIQAGLAQRAKLVVAGQQVYGPQVNRVFTDAETNDLTAAMQTMTPQQRVAFGATLYQGLGSFAPMAMQQIASKEPVFAHAAGLASVNPQTSLAIMEGVQLAQKNPVYAAAKDGDIGGTATAFTTATGSAFAAMPAYGGNIKRAADALYIRELNRQGKPLDLKAVDQDTYTRAVNLALGASPGDVENTGVVTIGAGWSDGITKQQVVLPPGVNKQTFEGYLVNLDRDAIDFKTASVGGVLPMDVNGKKIPMSQILDEGQFVQIGNGMYKVRMRDGNFLKGGGPTGDYILQADPNTINRTYNQPKLRNQPARPFGRNRSGFGGYG